MRKLPIQPGVYMHKDKTGKVIYVGKAKLLKNRVSNYFQPARTAERQDASWSTISTTSISSSRTASLKRSCSKTSMIKRQKPEVQHSAQKDDKGYPYVRLDPTLSYPDFKIVSSLHATTEHGTLVRSVHGPRRKTKRLIRDR